MEKLRFLLNEFEPYICKDGEHRDNLWYSVICGESAIFTKEIGIQKIISKEYKFIQRLVRENKIDTFKILEKRFDTQKGYEWVHYHTVSEGNTDLLLMLLSISDNPISDLISYLK